MKKKNYKKLLCACLLSLATFTSVGYATEGKQETTVSYTPSYEELEPTDVKVFVSAKTNKYGRIYDEEKELPIGETIYRLKDGETKIFRIRLVLGYDVEKVMYDEENITHTLRQARSIRKEYTLVIAGKGHNTELKVFYKKIGTESPTNPSDPGNINKPNHSTTSSSTSTPSTGDTTNIFWFVFTACTAMVVIIATLRKKKKDEEI